MISEHTTLLTMSISISSQYRWYTFSFYDWWVYRHVLLCFAKRDLLSRYKQTVVGIVWILLQPLCETVIFAVALGRYISVPGEIPYPLFVFSGLMLWTFFTQALSAGSQSIVSGKVFLKKMYFPRALLPVAKILTFVPDLCVTFLCLCVMMLWYDVAFSVQFFWIPLIIIQLCILIAGLSFWLSSLHALFRDIGLIIPYFLRVGMFVSPVLFASDVFQGQWRYVLYCNPVAGILEVWRGVLFAQSVDGTLLMMSVALTGVIFVTGILFFQRMERTFLDFL